MNVITAVKSRNLPKCGRRPPRRLRSWRDNDLRRPRIGTGSRPRTALLDRLSRLDDPCEVGALPGTRVAVRMKPLQEEALVLADIFRRRPRREAKDAIGVRLAIEESGNEEGRTRRADLVRAVEAVDVFRCSVAPLALGNNPEEVLHAVG